MEFHDAGHVPLPGRAASIGEADPGAESMIRVSLFALVTAVTAVTFVVPASAKSSHRAAVAHRGGRPLYDVVSRGPGAANGAVNSDDPSLTGGGSIGYNQMIYNW
jgi:hypothetical protein